MTTTIRTCQIWDSDPIEGRAYEADGYHDRRERMFHVDESPRAGGGYIIPEVVANSGVKNMTNVQKARLTTWLVNRRLQGDPQPTITELAIEYARNMPSLSVHERAERLLKYIESFSSLVGQGVNLNWEPAMTSGTDLCAMAWSESTELSEVIFLNKYLVSRNWVSSLGQNYYAVTVGGYGHIAEMQLNPNSAQAFVAMWFDGSMSKAFENGIEPAIVDAGYNPFLINRKEHINKIDDEIIAEIRRSRFLVADFTHGDDGARGSVYFEAGFAKGLGLDVVFTCHEDSLPDLHFDTEHYNHIVWTAPADLCEKLKNRILAVIGEGPEAHRIP